MSKYNLKSSTQFQSVQESDDEFFALWPHRYDYLWSEHPSPGKPPNWQTERRHPLSDRLISQGANLHGVRFKATTNYALLDIDCNSAYHPKRDIHAINFIMEALEPLGIRHKIALSSSDSGGIHIYLPFAKAQKCDSLALAIEALLKSKGFTVAPGQLEIFPNPRSYVPNSTPSLYSGHRLPLQRGSYLLNEDWDPVFSSRLKFVKRWNFCQSQNQVTKKTVKQVLKIYRRQQQSISTKATKFLNDLQTEIEQGWTGHGQTNRLLGRIAMCEYVFGHILKGCAPLESDELLKGCAPLESDELVKRIVEVATGLPGYREWCQHQHEIDERATEWARCVEASRYFHYGCKSSNLSHSKTESGEAERAWNQQQASGARDRIRFAIADLLNKGELPAQTTNRFKALTQYRISGSTLYRNRDLWHPDSLQAELPESTEIFSDPSQTAEHKQEQSIENYSQTASNLLPDYGCNTLRSNTSSDLQAYEQATGCNALPELASILEPDQATVSHNLITNPRNLHIRRREQHYTEQMQRCFDSSDTILRTLQKQKQHYAEQMQRCCDSSDTILRTLQKQKQHHSEQMQKYHGLAV